MPMMPFIGVRISWLIFARKSPLDRLAPNKYKDLYSAHDGVQEAVDELLAPHEARTDERLVIPLSVVDKQFVDSVGGKMANLGEIRKKLSMRVPDGFILIPLIRVPINKTAQPLASVISQK